jgi:DNA (cytosine-5)-methyltransferase 1
MKKMVSLFSGIGGFDRAFERHGYRAALLAENFEPAVAVLRKQFPHARLVCDVRQLDRLPAGTDLVTAGFPCQDLSSVGEKAGISGGRSSLVDEVFRLLETQRVEWVLIENVKFMLHLQRGAAMRRIVGRLESLGYQWAYRTLNSHAFGVPQRRERVFILASRGTNPRDILLGDTSETIPQHDLSMSKPVGFYWTEGAFATGLAANAVPPLKAGSTIGIPSPPAILMPDGRAVTPDIRDAERLQGFPANWTAAAATAARDSTRWKLVGNAVTVPVAEWIARRLTKPSRPTSILSRKLRMKDRWPAAAWGSAEEGRFAADVGQSIREPRLIGLDEYLRFEPKLLSAKATTGFVTRARRGNLAYPDGFLDCLEEHAARMAAASA